MLKILSLLILSLNVVSAWAQQTAVRVKETTSTDSTINIANKDMPIGMDIYNMARVATEHHYPLPEEVFAIKIQLGLDALQSKKLSSIIQTLNLKKQEISQSVALNEKRLNQLFASRKLDDGTIIFYGNRYGLYEGEMRTALLTACIQTAQVLTPKQMTKFEQIRNHSN